MSFQQDPAYASEITYQRLIPLIQQEVTLFESFTEEKWQIFKHRLETHFDRLFGLLMEVYGEQFDFYYHLEQLILMMANYFFERPKKLVKRDLKRETDPYWYQDHNQVGAVCYVDLFAGNLKGLFEKIPYLKELGITYLHLMPLFKCPEAESDGGYAVSSFREVNPSLGSMKQLRKLAKALHKEGISLALDLVFNHTSDEHEWAQLAREGNQRYENFYFIYDDREIPDQYERTLREIFPDEHPGAFTFLEEQEKWVWTTFHSYQWDLNYANPDVFNAMAEEMLFLANVGTDVIRLDAVPFIWKQMGTSCENLPKAHTLIQAFNTVCRIATPALIFKSEAIVHPDDVKSYVDSQECQISYNPLFMALLWNTLATREVNLIKDALIHRHPLPEGCAWVNYVRCHDDIGWTFADEDANRYGINGFDHRRFLNEFYRGRFPGSFALGLTFQENPKTGDARICGTCASLAGLEKALDEQNQTEIDFSIQRILLLHGLILTLGGMPLIYLGDELGLLNDYSYKEDPGKVHDSRWVHRPSMVALQAPNGEFADIFNKMKRLIHIRKNEPVFSGTDLRVININNPHVLGFIRSTNDQQALVIANFSEHPQFIIGDEFQSITKGTLYKNLQNNKEIMLEDVQLKPYQLLLLRSVDETDDF